MESVDGPATSAGGGSRSRKWRGAARIGAGVLTFLGGRLGRRDGRLRRSIRQGLLQHRLSAGLAEIKVVPEDSVEAFFRSEQAQADSRRSGGAREIRGTAASPFETTSEEVAEGGGPQEGDVKEADHHAASEMWDTAIDAAVHPEKRKLDPEVLADCEAARMLFLGSMGNEELRTAREKERVFYVKCGQRDSVLKLARAFRGMDSDKSGRVHLYEFREYSSKFDPTTFGPIAARVEQALLGRKSSFTLEDMMRLCWPCARIRELRAMQAMVIERRSTNLRIKTPPLLPHSEYEGLLENFRFFDVDGNGTVSFDELVETGLVDKETEARYKAEWDRTGDGTLNVAEFCEMLCPTGFRAFPGALVASDFEGNRLEFEEGAGWRLAEAKQRGESREGVGGKAPSPT